MKWILFLVGIIFLGVVFLNRETKNSKTDVKQNQSVQNQAVDSKNMNITSSAFKNNEKIPQKYTCDGEGINPSLEVSSVPANAKSLALIVEDPDAPNGTFIHWVVYNISVNPGGMPVKEFGENQVPKEGLEGVSSTGKPGYVAPCPPSGTHRYIFTLYALDTTDLNLPGSPTKAQVQAAMQGYIIEQAQLTGLYGRT